ncbi:hypothetical protein FJ444_16740 [Aestuariibacter sp. GS-14]|uniref:hypothetical protein n=1 Tax=Aestuariibacter sp. GS-14 TaxID=2590670 RepID=UPI00112C71F2|nr:hypothetical protein [Aestuariibacter sp. GS-14]TPV55764.1 hypothetical protein FJ444_16740 [Aestuariibacter sp. GS-14]
MRLLPENISVSEQLDEFDQWMTAKLERVKDTEKFNMEINSICDCIERLSLRLKSFGDHNDCEIDKLCLALIDACSELVSGDDFSSDETLISEFIDSFFNLLFLTSGATDNNLKNHFLIKLKDDEINPMIPKRGPSKKTIKFKLVQLPSTTKSDYISKLLAGCLVGSHEAYAQNVVTEPLFDLYEYLAVFLKEYTSLILEDQDEIMQFWAICSSYIRLNDTQNEINMGKYLLNSCTIFKVRGSVSASGGHIPEDILREKLNKIGLRPNTDYNLNDVIVGEQVVQEGGKRKIKTRAYDFILPFNVKNWEPKPKLFIQSQFYAGDSGSVSHKVVDQTQSSRAFTLEKYPTARFVEYLDGAGYYASLRGDLQHMLAFSNTASFFQVKSILVRLRRELQVIKFLTPIDLEHVLLTTMSNDKKTVIKELADQEYPENEIERVINTCIEEGFIESTATDIFINQNRIEIARRLLILDVAVNNASTISDSQRYSQKYLILPGYGRNYGVLESELSEAFYQICKQHVPSAPTFSKDIEWLLDEGVVKRR